MSSHYGPRPKVFEFEDEKYFIGNDVGAYLKCHRGSLYKRYPLLFKRLATPDERKQISEILGSSTFLCSTIMLVKASEAEDIFNGNEDKYRSGGPGSGMTAAQPLVRQDNIIPVKTKNAGSLWSNTQMSGTHHLESIPCSTPASGGRGKIRHREHIYSFDNPAKLEALEKNANLAEDLVPIRLDMDIDGIRLRDTFCYNRNETLITPEMVAEIICEDLELPQASFLNAIATSIHQQIEIHKDVIPIDEDLELPQASFLNAIATSIHQQIEIHKDVIPIDEGVPDQRAVMKLNIHVGNESLTDQFEWDMSNRNFTPEQFARHLCSDLCIGGEFEGAIAYSLRGQLAWNQRTFAYSETPLPKIENPFRGPLDVDNWLPSLEVLSDAEVEKKMRDQDRNTRRMRRLVNSNPYG
uniref:SWI/SNF-related matrix-associated actin-dependent regulator of chromatin subfamily B member 1 n=1 Tax=Panagrolaimus sp. ES5 TaxID=591445 RepID=A0AC34GQZ6_9BILA